MYAFTFLDCLFLHYLLPRDDNQPASEEPRYREEEVEIVITLAVGLVQVLHSVVKKLWGFVKRIFGRRKRQDLDKHLDSSHNHR